MSKQTLKINNEQGTFTASDGVQLFEQSWFSKTEPKAIVVIIHGYAEHSTRYAHVAEYFASSGFAVHTFDLRGHGKSDGKNTHVNSFDEYLTDVDTFLSRVRDSHPGKKIFLLGHSMGGAIASLYVITRQPDLAGLLLSGAAVKISDDISPFLIKISGIIAGILPKLPTIKLDGTAISRDPQIVEKYDNDPLVYRGGIPARSGAEINRSTIQIQEKMEAIKLPLLVMHGTADRLADPEGSKQLYTRASSEDKTLKLYEGLYHEILNEPEKENVMADIVAWLDNH